MDPAPQTKSLPQAPIRHPLSNSNTRCHMQKKGRMETERRSSVDVKAIKKLLMRVVSGDVMHVILARR